MTLHRSGTVWVIVDSDERILSSHATYAAAQAAFERLYRQSQH